MEANEVIVEADESSLAATQAAPVVPPAPRRVSLMGSTRNRKKSRRMTLTQSISASSISAGDTEPIIVSSTAIAQQQQEEVRRIERSLIMEGSLKVMVNMLAKEDRLSQQVTSSSSAADSSSGAQQPERKISRIFSILQAMQQTFFLHQQQQGPSPPHQPLTESPSVSISRTGSVVQPPYRQQQLFAMGQSQESMVFHPSRPLRNPVLDRLNRFGSINSWTGSECSDVSSSTTLSSTPPPLVHAVPYHKDGW